MGGMLLRAVGGRVLAFVIAGGFLAGAIALIYRKGSNDFLTKVERVVREEDRKTRAAIDHDDERTRAANETYRKLQEEIGRQWRRTED